MYTCARDSYVNMLYRFLHVDANTSREVVDGTPGIPLVQPDYPLVMTYKKLLKMAIEIVDFPTENGDFP